MSARITWGGIAGIAAAALFILTAIINQLSPIQQTYDSAASYTYVAAALAAYIGIIVALLGIDGLHRRSSRYGRLGIAGTVITIAGYVVVAVTTVISMIAGHASLLGIRLGAAGLIVIGSVLLGVIMLRARLLPWWCGVLLIATFPLGHFANDIFGSVENLLMALLWGSVGVGLLTRREGAADSIASQPAQAG